MVEEKRKEIIRPDINADKKESVIINKNTSKKKPVLILGVVAVLIAAAGIAAYFTGIFDINSVQQDKNAVVKGKVAIKVNGEVITNEQIDQRIKILLSTIQNAEQPTPEQLKQTEQLARQQLINETLILQSASTQGLSVTQDEINKEFNTIVDSFHDQAAFKQALAKNNVTPDQLRGDLGRQLLIKKYINQEVDATKIVVTEDEIGQLYEQYSQQQENMPPLETIYDQISQQISQQKLNTQVANLVNGLQDSANIEIIN